MKCGVKGCEGEAICGIAIDVPAIGYPVDEGTVRVVFGYELCEDCFNATEPKEFLNDEDPRIKQFISSELARRGLEEADFSRAFVSKVMLDSEEWEKFCSIRKQ